MERLFWIIWVNLMLSQRDRRDESEEGRREEIVMTETEFREKEKELEVAFC